MEEKRLRDDADEQDSDLSSDNKRIRTFPPISTIFRETAAIRSIQNFVSALEPLLRRVVNEEVERGLVQGVKSLQRAPLKQTQAVEAAPLQLIFSNRLCLPIFTGSKIEDEGRNPLRLLLIDGLNGSRSPVSLPSSVRVEIVVLDSDFPGELEDWTRDEFERNMVKERTGRRPLITGDVMLTLRDGCTTIGDLTFTDNSSWIRSRNFRLGARVLPGSNAGLRIKEAITEPFTVKDHRGELYRKHYPPSLQDEVWRLERIGKDGVFHQKLRAEGINTVQEFLKLSVVDHDQLRNILGAGMSDRMWEGTIAHARTCAMGSKLYLYRSPRSAALLLNPICQVQGMVIDGQAFPPNCALNGAQRAFLRQLVLDAYKQWDQLEELDDVLGRAALQEQCNVWPQPQIAMAPSAPSAMYHPTTQETTTISTYQTVGFELGDFNGGDVVQVEFGRWANNPADDATASVHRSYHNVYNMSDMSSEDDGDSNQGFSGAFGQTDSLMLK